MALLVLAAAPFSTAGIRVWFSAEPRLVSPIAGPRDALDRRAWSVSVVSGPGMAPVVLEVMGAEADPDFDAGYPDAWFVDVRVDRQLRADTVYLVVASSELASAAGDPLAGPPDDRARCPGMAPRMQAARSPAPRRGGLDVNYDGTRFVFDAGGDLATHAAPATTSKRAQRRLTTQPGAFYHLPTYGVGQAVKKLARIAPAIFSAEARRQLLAETDVADAGVSIRNVGPIWIVNARVRVAGTQVPIDVVART